jgi:carboxylesterase type B
LLDPIVDGDIIARWSSEQLKKGTFVHVPTIDGTNTDEGISFSLCGINTVEDFAGNISSTDSFQYIPSEYVSDLLAHYPNTPEYWIPPVGEIGLNYTYPAEHGSLYRWQTAYWGDVMFVALRRGTCQTWAAAGLPVYSYRFNTLPNGYGAGVGVTHATEVSFPN